MKETLNITVLCKIITRNTGNNFLLLNVMPYVLTIVKSGMIGVMNLIFIKSRIT